MVIFLQKNKIPLDRIIIERFKIYCGEEQIETKLFKLLNKSGRGLRFIGLYEVNIIRLFFMK